MDANAFAEAAAALRGAKAVVAFTGAGISAESGVPTFRDAQTGLWAKFDPMELATPEAFQRDPERVWRWYLHRRILVRQAQPNAGHLALVEIERRVPAFLLATQNVDNLHRDAGQRRMVELHGNLFRTVPVGGGKPVEIPDEPDDIPPRDPETGRLLRPDVVW
ncbi:MAG: NAD-dependent protein deacylase, partial [Candidatus Dadabacteria bacterium]